MTSITTRGECPNIRYYHSGTAIGGAGWYWHDIENDNGGKVKSPKLREKLFRLEEELGQGTHRIHLPDYF